MTQECSFYVTVTLFLLNYKAICC